MMTDHFLTKQGNLFPNTSGDTGLKTGPFIPSFPHARGPSTWKVLVLAALSILLALPGLVFGAAGSTSANFLKIGMGARGAAMADAYTAAVDDATAVYWNPAGLVLATGTEFSLTHSQWLQGVNIDSFAMSRNFGAGGAVGIGLTSLGTRSFLSTVEDTAGNYNGTGTAATAADYSLSLAYATSLGRFVQEDFFRNILVGLKANVVAQNFDGLGGDALSIDLGLMRTFPSEHITLGLDVQNVGTSIQDRAEPVLVKGGVVWSLSDGFQPGDRLILAADADIHTDAGFQPRLGAEYRMRVDREDVAALRAGIRTTDDQYGFSFAAIGAGLERTFVGVTAGLDYAFVPYGAIGATHRLTLNLRFGGGEKRLTASLDGPGGFEIGSPSVPLTTAVVSDSGVYGWTLDVSAPGAGTVRRFEGKGTPPGTVVWDGMDVSGRPVPPGKYLAELTVRDLEEKTAGSGPVTLTAKKQPRRKAAP